MPIAWNRINTLLLVLVLLVLAGSLAKGVLGGPLDPPPGPPASTMKPLDQVEPRIPISQPATAAGFPIIISQPGSYYLTGNITGVAGANGINVSAHDVTIDLNGFTLNGVPASGSGILSNGWNTMIKNGGVSYWGGHGILLQQPNARVEKVQARSNGANGIFAAGGVEDSISTNNGGTGITIYGDGASVRDNTVAANGAGGILVSGRVNRIEGNTVSGFIFSPLTVPFGIRVTGTRNFIVRNSASYNFDNFDIAADNTAGPEETAAATSPWSNVNF